MAAEDCLVWEREQERRHEFVDGEVFALAGGSPRHNAICCAAVIGDLRAALRDSDCRVLTSDQRLPLASQNRYVYPDAIVVCGPLELQQGTRDVATNPRLLVEVLSANTEANDRGSKWDGYRRLESLEDYLLVSQRSACVEHYHRLEDGSWRYTVAGPGQAVTVAGGAILEVDSLYDRVFDLPGDDAEGDTT